MIYGTWYKGTGSVPIVKDNSRGGRNRKFLLKWPGDGRVRASGDDTVKIEVFRTNCRDRLEWSGRMISVVRLVVVIALALAAGYIGLAMLFGDLGPGETALSRAALVAGLHTLAGMVIGFIEPERWQVAALAAWGAVVIGLGALLGSLGRGIGEALMGLVFLAPLALALAGGYLGRWLRRRTGRES
jgi:hypothetical protein